MRVSKEKLIQVASVAVQPSSDFDLNPSIPVHEATLRPASVLVLFTQIQNQTYVTLTKRASHLKSHPGQIAFAGGKQDEADTSIVQTALREAQEEIGIDPKEVSVLGRLPPHRTVTNFQVSPVLAWMNIGSRYSIEPAEVAEVFHVPAEHLLNAQNFRIEHRFWNGQKRYYYSVPFGPYYIWGATARILRGLAEGMKN